jgi:hypothetical protein
MARVKNLTSYPTDEVRRLVRRGLAGLDAKGVAVTVRPARERAHGRAWGQHRFTIWLPPADRFPFFGYRRHRSSPFNHDWQNWREALVALSAHEGRHCDLNRIWAYRRGRSQQAIEMACEAWEHGALKEYRASLNGDGRLTE